jgi:hypothetical protein
MRFSFPISSYASTLLEAVARVDEMDAQFAQSLARAIKPGVRLTPSQRRSLRFLRLTRKDIEDIKAA